jgi:hypothetical protein
VSLAPAEPRRSRGFLLVLLCFVLGAAIAALGAWKFGKIGPNGAEEERFVARATDAMFKNHFHEPAGENVKEITDEGLRRWPTDGRFTDIRVRAANELTSQALTQRSTGDILEALRLAKVAHELDPHDPSAKRLVEQYEGELATFSPSAAPTLVKPLDRPPTPANNPRVPGSPKAPPAEPAMRIDYKALVDVSTAAPRLGQTVDLTARIAPSKGDFDSPGFTIAGPGVPGGIRMPAQNTAPGVFKASYAFLEPGKFEITFTTQADGKLISAKRTVNAGGTAAPLPSATPPQPPPSGSVKWM